GSDDYYVANVTRPNWPISTFAYFRRSPHRSDGPRVTVADRVRPSLVMHVWCRHPVPCHTHLVPCSTPDPCVALPCKATWASALARPAEPDSGPGTERVGLEMDSHI